LNAAWDRTDSGGGDRLIKAFIARELATVCENTNRPDEALEYLAQSLDFDPLQVDGYLASAELLLRIVGTGNSTDTIVAGRRRARLSKAIRWLDRAEENARKSGRDQQLTDPISKLRLDVERAIGQSQP